MVIGSDSGRIVILEYNPTKNTLEKVHQETFGKSGCRRIVPGQYLAVDPKGRAVMIGECTSEGTRVLNVVWQNTKLGGFRCFRRRRETKTRVHSESRRGSQIDHFFAVRSAQKQHTSVSHGGCRCGFRKSVIRVFGNRLRRSGQRSVRRNGAENASNVDFLRDEFGFESRGSQVQRAVGGARELPYFSARRQRRPQRRSHLFGELFDVQELGRSTRYSMSDT